MRKIAGSILVGFGLTAAVLNEWMKHFFYAQYNIAKGMMLQEGRKFHQSCNLL
jgi:hypothetical protein